MIKNIIKSICYNTNGLLFRFSDPVKRCISTRWRWWICTNRNFVDENTVRDAKANFERIDFANRYSWPYRKTFQEKSCLAMRIRGIMKNKDRRMSLNFQGYCSKPITLNSSSFSPIVYDPNNVRNSDLHVVFCF